MWVTSSAIEDLSWNFNNKSFYIHEPIVGIALLAEYITPEKKLFREWFTDVLKRAAEVYPCRYNYSDDGVNEKEEYDYSSEPPVFREFFFDSDSYDEEVVKQRANIFMQSVKDDNNPYLRSSEEMIELGFNGTPYIL
ncbi:MAG: hypothetical protein FWG14_02000 [Peptococcaceae bacterium]|nr:hypothetical protein [Peptococcaceae bacterium]